MISKIEKISSLSLNINSTIKDAMKIINKNEIGACILTNNKNHFISLITDGDLRRFILKKNDINASLNFFKNKKTLTASKLLSQSDIQNKMTSQKILHLPVIDKKKCCHLYFLDNLNKEIIKEDFIIFAGGFGKRLLPITENKPKALVEFLGKPLILHILEKAINEGFINFTLILHYKADMIKRFLINHKISNNININFIVEKKPLGTIGGVALIKKFSGDNFLITNCDVIADINYKNLIRYHLKNKYSFTTATKKKLFDIPYGVISQKNSKLLNIHEKPKIEFDINCGIYVLNKNILKFIKKNQYLDINVLIARLLKNKKIINNFPIIESWKDIGQKGHLSYYELK